MILIRPEMPSDQAPIRRVTIEAFANSEFGHNGEAELVDLLRENCERRVSLVAVQDDEIVGHVLFTPAEIRTAGHHWQGWGLGPLSVITSRQQKGIGSALVVEGLARLAAGDGAFVIVLGHPEYYQRFGFVLAPDLGISHGFAGIPQELFFIRAIVPGIQSLARGSVAYYRPEFGTQHRALHRAGN
jgi:putative acetyltransferase